MFFKHKKFISFLLILCTVFSMCSQLLTVFAVDGSGIENEIAETETIYDYPQAEILELDANDVPELINFNEAKEKGHVLRLREKEPDNNTVVFLNEDNTETMYIFAEPIKYTDESGEVKDKSRNLSLVDGKYTMSENDVLVNFPSKVSDGISASKGEYTVSMVPIPTISETITTDTTAVLANNKVIYSDVFGTADVLYTPLYSGFKEDIILDSYGGVNEFNFFVYTNGLSPIKNENGSVSFFDPDTAESVAEMMQVVCYDANNKFAGGDVVLTEIKENQIYGFTVVADAAFLSDESTVYPVSVDPTLSFSGTTAIEDAVVYSGKPAKNYANYNYNNIGYVDSSYKIGELLIKFPTLSSNSTFASLDDTDISSAKLTLYTASGGSGTETIKAYRYHGTWNESTVTWNDLAFLTPPILVDTTTVSSSSLSATSFDITQAVKDWASSDQYYVTPNNGIVLMNSNESDPDECRDFLSTEYAASHSNTGMPRLEIKHFNFSGVFEFQEQTKWCWIASARMASAFYHEPSVSQASAAVKVKLDIETSSPTADMINEANQGGDEEETAEALSYFLNNEYDVFYRTGYIYSINTLMSLLDAGTPVIALRTYVSSTGQVTTGHATLIVDYYYDTNATEYRFVVLDPSPLANENVFYTNYFTFCDGRTNGRNGYVWQSVVVVAEGNYNVTTPAPYLPPQT